MSSSTGSKKRLRSGFTTGTAAAAAAKAAITLLVHGIRESAVTIHLLTGDYLSIPVHSLSLDPDGKKARCTVIKDAGDDPDVTNGAEIGAVVWMSQTGAGQGVILSAGTGVGTVTLPGLEIPPGEPAINSGPRQMIHEAVFDVLKDIPPQSDIRVQIFVPEGESLAVKTLNARLGIIGGISILGTTGVVRPLSHEAYAATITSALSVALATGNRHVVLTTGRRSERFAIANFPDLPQAAFIQIGDFFHDSLKQALQIGIRAVTLAVFFGKAVKMATGIPHTHAASSPMTLHQLSEWTQQVTHDPVLARTVDAAHTAREALSVLMPEHLSVIAHVGRNMIDCARQATDGRIQIGGIIFDFDGNIIFHEAAE